MMRIGFVVACRSQVSEVPSLTPSADLAPGCRCLCHVDRSGRGPIITLIIPIPPHPPPGEKACSRFDESTGKCPSGSWTFREAICKFVLSSTTWLLVSLRYASIWFRVRSLQSRLKARLEKLTRLKARLSIALVSLSRGATPTDFGTANALTIMRSNFDVDSTVMTRQLVEVRKNYFIPLEYELHAPLLGERPYDAFSSGFSLLTDALEAAQGSRVPAKVDVGASMAEKHPSTGEVVGLRKRLRKVALEQPADASGSIMRTPLRRENG
ncbi:hypothetical protein B296_00048283 [Ensete ventricosum]|uniref:Uncharacterized protein n=1 Tax=Ensete ventricosum TaxID=4639 RepID=A0A426Y9C3_ENSVE|nr:hypothetical protein B296_00048283 [Ensete ventricosum]